MILIGYLEDRSAGFYPTIIKDRKSESGILYFIVVLIHEINLRYKESKLVLCNINEIPDRLNQCE